MKRRWHAIAVVVLLAISAALLMGSVAPSSHAKGNVHTLKAALKQAGFFVPKDDSALASFDMPSEVCCPVDAKFRCMYNNVNAPYLVSKVLPGPGEVTVPLPNNNFHLGQNEALILVGETPPPMAYFSYTVFMGSRRTTRWPYSFGIFSLVNDYVADSINNMTINTGDPTQGPFNRQMLLFIVADQEVEARVHQAAVAAGYPPSMFNTIVLPPAVLHLGVGAMADSFFLVQRTAWPDQQAALDEYLTHPQTILRATLQDPAWQPKPIPVPKVAIHGTGETELNLVPAVDALGEAIKAEYSSNYTAAEQKLDWFYWDGYTGLQEEVNEFAPSSDAAGPRTDEQFFLPQGSFAMVYGVNHHATGKTSYSSFSLYEDNLAIGLDSVFDPQYAGTATDYLPPETANIDKLYAWKIAWDCNGQDHCMTIKQPVCARLNLTTESPFKLIFRLYLEPETKTGPEIREILFDRVMVFTPKPKP